MLRAQQACYHKKLRTVIVFEGWDASGKGGSIRRLTGKLDPRGFRVYPISAPSDYEQSIHYLYRFYKRLPGAGEIAIFDRSWYGRVLVERVEGFASKEEWQRAYREINEFEKWLTDDGVRVIKLFLHIDKSEQLNRFEERLHNPDKRWKLTKEDVRNRKKWPKYEQAINDMMAHTHTPNAPWQIIPANHKWYARLACLTAVFKAMANGVDLEPPPIDEALVKVAEKELGVKAP